MFHIFYSNIYKSLSQGGYVSYKKALYFFFRAITVYDRPPQHFKPITLEEKHEFLVHFSQKYASEILSDSGESLLTENSSDGIKLKSIRPGLLVSSTSWTEDEDFSVLLSALQGFLILILNRNTSVEDVTLGIISTQIVGLTIVDM